MISCVISQTLGEPVDFGWIRENELATIRKVIIKYSDGRRQTRYTVCTGNVLWNTADNYTLREARAEVARLQEEARAAQYYAMNI